VPQSKIQNGLPHPMSVMTPLKTETPVLAPGELTGVNFRDGAALNAEGTSAAASGLHIGIFKLKSSAFECLQVIDLGAAQVHQ